VRGLLTAIEAVRPKSIAELLDVLAQRPGARPIAGGTDVMVRLEAGLDPAECYVDLTGLGKDLRYVRTDDGHLEIGGLATFWDVRTDASVVRRFPLLEEAARTIGAVQIQSRGTWAGNVANGSPAADGVAALLCYDAEVVCVSKGGRRIAPLHGFFTGYKVMDLRPGEYIAAIRLPVKDADRRHAFHKVGTRRAQAITKVGLAFAQRADGSHRVVGISMAPFVTRYAGIEAVLDKRGSRAELDAALDALVKPIDDIRSTAVYRKRVFAALVSSEAGG